MSQNIHYYLFGKITATTRHYNVTQYIKPWLLSFQMIVQSCLSLLTARSVEVTSIGKILIFSAVGVAAGLLC